MSAGRLIVCPTPIGNLEDVTLRVLAALREADIVACEDTRRTRVLLDRYGVAGKLVSYHEHNERARAGELVAQMRDGAVVALVSDAGTPLVSDPGFVLVQACVAAGLAVEVLPGPSAALAALVASALPADRWRFVGFLPRKKGELQAAFGGPETLVAFESPRRVAASLQVLAALDPERPVAVARELTKIHEEVVRGTAAELAARYADEPPRGEVALVVGGAPSVAADDDRAGARCGEAAGRGRREAAARRVGGVRSDRRSRQPAVPRVDGATRRRPSAASAIPGPDSVRPPTERGNFRHSRAVHRAGGGCLPLLRREIRWLTAIGVGEMAEISRRGRRGGGRARGPRRPGTDARPPRPHGCCAQRSPNKVKRERCPSTSPPRSTT